MSDNDSHDDTDIQSNMSAHDNDYIPRDDEEVDEIMYDATEECYILKESRVITNTCLYAYATKFLKLVEDRILYWPVEMLHVINFLTKTSAVFDHEWRTLSRQLPFVKEIDTQVNMGQLFTEVNLVMIMLMLDVPCQLDIKIKNTIVDLNKRNRKISYRMQPFHEALIVVNIMLKRKVIEIGMLRNDVRTQLGDRIEVPELDVQQRRSN